MDLLVYDKAGDDPSNAPLRAIIEFKTNANMCLVRCDIERTKHLLSILCDQRPLPAEGSRFGYQLLCVSYKTTTAADMVKIDLEHMTELAHTLGLGPLDHNEFKITQFDGSELYCGIIGLEVVPSLR